ncbi:DUF1990 family protein [Phytohabitans kaempferiae]|uniref:DUF1990 family protein n=1 Tax=Phytohabitans kaempferiae TaxID=1620943 RepID=A0ABV6M963_9ACTN
MTDATPTTYPEVGHTRRGPLPAGYRHMRHRTRLGAGDAVFAVAAQAVLSWRMHRAMRVGIDPSAPRADAGVTVVTRPGVGPLRLTAPCVVVWAEDGPERAGFGYGTTAGHPFSGEEAFVVTRDADGSVWLDVVSFSRPAQPWVRLAGPAAPWFQRAYAAWCGVTLRRLLKHAAPAPGEAAA